MFSSNAMSIIGAIYLLLSTVSSQYTSTGVTGSYPMVLPRACRSHAVGYDEANDTILIVGGLSPNEQQLVSFKNNTFTDHGVQYYQNRYMYGFAQFYTTMNQKLWMIDANGTQNSLIYIDLSTRNLVEPSIIIPIRMGLTGCLASFGGEYLFVVGGKSPTTSFPINNVQLFNITSGTWMNVASMHTTRTHLACIAHKQKLYAIGGDSKNSGGYIDIDSIESLYLGYDLSNIQNEQWLYENYTLSLAGGGSRAFGYGNDIIIFGGVKLSNSIYSYFDVQVIDTMTNTINVYQPLAIPMGQAGVIIVGQTLYGFGGWSDATSTIDSYQYILLTPTSEPTPSPSLPTAQPSTTPTQIPTDSTSTPTNSPSQSPTNAPSNVPSQPSNDPSNAPSQSPTNYPSQSPSKYPSSAPSKSPTSSPSDLPSQSPSQTPSEHPSKTPSQPPSNYPSSTLLPSTHSTVNEVDSAVIFCKCIYIPITLMVIMFL